MDKIPTSWNEFFQVIQNKDYSIRLHKFLDDEYANYVCYPPRNLLFNAFKLTPLEKVKVVIIGQDPYHEPGQAMGLSFSVPETVKIPPSLVNIYKEIGDEYDTSLDGKSGDLTRWAVQGVLLLNARLSVRQGIPKSHDIKEYKMFLQEVLEVIDKQNKPIVFMLWGGLARELKKYLHNPSHLVLECAHPSPMSANQGGWFKNNHFRLANEYLKKNKTSPIDWIK